MNELIRKLLIAVVNGLILIGLSLVFFRVIQLWSGTELTFLISAPAIFQLCLLSLSILLLSSATWYLVLRVMADIHIPYSVAVEQTSLMLAGKYIPGKVWGILIRAITAKRYGVSGISIASMSIVELLATIFIISFLGIILIVGAQNIYSASGLLLLFLLAGFYLFKLFYWFSLKFLIWLQKKGKFINLKLNMKPVKAIHYSVLVGGFAGQWVLTATVMWILLGVLNIEVSITNFMLLVGAYMLSVVTGFVAFFAPGGIGVREGAFIFLVGSVLTPLEGAQFAIMLRSWNVLYDLFAALIGVFIYMRARHA